MSLGKGRKNSGNLQKKLVENAEFFIIWRFPFPDVDMLNLRAKCIICASTLLQLQVEPIAKCGGHKNQHGLGAFEQ
jgi:hypothetical protein